MAQPSPAAADRDHDVDLGGGLRFLVAGDRYCLLELGGRIELGLNLRAIQLANRLLAERVEGIVETLPIFVSVLVHYDSTTLAPAKLRDIVAGVWREVGAEADVVVPSRLIEVPVCYHDRWTRACVEEYARNIKPIEDNLAFVARINGLPSPEAFARRHAFTQHWVGGVGFWPGLPDMMPLDPRCQHSVPKYDPPRLSTVSGAIGVGGGFTSIYPMNTPGGYYLIGRTPVPIFSQEQRLAPFRTQATLFEPGDRIRFRAVDEAEFEAIEAAAAAGAYRYDITDFELFSLRRHEAWSHATAAAEAVEPLAW